jgi:tripartite-type tricarboxylate transporter receptor subunit TctC
METPAVRARLEELGVSIVAPEQRSQEYLKEFVAAEIEKWTGLIKAAGIAVESSSLPK